MGSWGNQAPCQFLGHGRGFVVLLPRGVRAAWLWLKLRALPGYFGPQMAGLPLPLLPSLLPEERLALISPVSEDLGLVRGQSSECRATGRPP